MRIALIGGVRSTEVVLHKLKEYNFSDVFVFGYKPKLNSPAKSTIDIFQLVIASGSGDGARPDLNYALSSRLIGNRCPSTRREVCKVQLVAGGKWSDDEQSWIPHRFYQLQES